VDEAMDGHQPPHAGLDDAHLPAGFVAAKQPAPHTLQQLRLVFATPPHDRYALWVRVGAGGGHSLHLHQPHLWPVAGGARVPLARVSVNLYV
jgi:hypothetical protein